MTLTDNGIVIRTLEETVSDNIDRWGNNTGEIDVSPTSASGELVAITSEIETRVEQDVAEAISQNTISGATDAYLDALAELKSTTRRRNIPTVVYCFIQESAGYELTVIPAGTPLRCTANSEIFNTVEAITTSASGEYVAAYSENIGVSCPANTIEFSPAITGISISNNRAGVIGLEEETDTDLRARLQNLGSPTTVNLKDGLRLKLLDTVGVTKVNILDNNTDAAIEGVPARNFAPVIQGGHPSEIADIIYNFSGVGNPSFGALTRTAKTATGGTATVKYSIPSEVLATIAITLTTDSTYDANVGDAEVREAIATYINSLNIGDTVILQKIEAAALIKGVLGASATINTVAGNLAIAYNEIAYTSVDDVTIL